MTTEIDRKSAKCCSGCLGETYEKKHSAKVLKRGCHGRYVTLQNTMKHESEAAVPRSRRTKAWKRVRARTPNKQEWAKGPARGPQTAMGEGARQGHLS